MQWSNRKRFLVELVVTAIVSPFLIFLLFAVGAPRTVLYPTLLLGQPIIAMLNSSAGSGTAVAVDSILAWIDTWIVLMIVVTLYEKFLRPKRENA
jgi:hypothetical protein